MCRLARIWGVHPILGSVRADPLIGSVVDVGSPRLRMGPVATGMGCSCGLVAVGDSSGDLFVHRFRLTLLPGAIPHSGSLRPHRRRGRREPRFLPVPGGRAAKTNRNIIPRSCFRLVQRSRYSQHLIKFTGFEASDVTALSKSMRCGDVHGPQ